MNDTLLAAARLTERRAWLRAARGAPIPPPRVPYAPLRIDDHRAAIDAALAAGRTSLQEWREGRMARLSARGDAPPQPQDSPRTTCVACGLYAPRALVGHAVCVHCANAPDVARATIEARRARTLRGLELAQGELDAALDALDDDGRARWVAICQARLAVGRVGRWEGTADDATRQRLQRTQRAIDSGDPRVPEPLRRVWHADEALFWAGQVAADEGRRVDVAAAQLEACLAALAQRALPLEEAA